MVLKKFFMGVIGIFLLFTLGACTDKIFKIKKTGQTKSYDTSGKEVTDGSIKDDGYYQKGVLSNYTRDTVKEVVIDNLTGLMWQDDKDAKTVTRKLITQANYDLKRKDDTSGVTAATYCTELTLGGFKDWRLPTIGELIGLVDYGRYRPAINSKFINVQKAEYYWSSSGAYGKCIVWRISSMDGGTVHSHKLRESYVRCVRKK